MAPVGANHGREQTTSPPALPSFLRESAGYAAPEKDPRIGTATAPRRTNLDAIAKSIGCDRAQHTILIDLAVADAVLSAFLLTGASLSLAPTAGGFLEHIRWDSSSRPF